MAAMKLLGLPAKRTIVAQLVAQLVRRRRGTAMGMPVEMDLDIEEFVELMTIFFVDRRKMTRLHAAEDARGRAARAGQQRHRDGRRAAGRGGRGAGAPRGGASRGH